MENYQLRLDSLKDFLDETLAFLTPYLPLANAHGSEFITEEQWERLLPGNIREELMVCTDEELKKLPMLGYPQADKPEDVFDHLHTRATRISSDTDTTEREGDEKSVAELEKQGIPSVNDAAKEIALKCVLNENPHTSDDSHSKTDEMANKASSDIKHLMKNSKASDCFNENDKSDDMNSQSQHCQKGMYTSLRDFCHCAWRNTIDGQGLSVSVIEMVEQLGYVKADNDSDVFVPIYMNQKKSHEIDTMSEVCAHLSRSTQCQLVVDVGSGKGYLGQTLYLQQKLAVLGIDAVPSNTSGAERRLGIVGRQWVGLNRNIKNVNNNVKLTKKEKKQTKLKDKEKLQTVVGNSIDNFGATETQLHSNSKVSDKDKEYLENGCYIPLTMYVDTSTDLKSIATELVSHLPVDETTIHISNKTTEDSVICQNSQLKGVSGNTVKTNEVDLKSSALCEHGAKTGNSKGLDHFQTFCKHFSSPMNTDERYISKLSAMQMKTNECDMDMLLTGLHTCGDLASTMLKLFVSNSDVKCLCSVGCCYHLLTEEFLQEMPSSVEHQQQYGFPLSSYLKEKKVCLGNTARNLASQSVHRMVNSEEGYRFYSRALLQKMIVDLVDPSSIQWTGLRQLEQRSTGTVDYIMKAWKKLKLPKDLITEKVIEAYTERYKHKQHQLAVFFQLKAVLALCIESLILLDKICFLMEQVLTLFHQETPQNDNICAFENAFEPRHEKTCLQGLRPGECEECIAGEDV